MQLATLNNNQHYQQKLLILLKFLIVAINHNVNSDTFK